MNSKNRQHVRQPGLHRLGNARQGHSGNQSKDQNQPPVARAQAQKGKDDHRVGGLSVISGRSGISHPGLLRNGIQTSLGFKDRWNYITKAITGIMARQIGDRRTPTPVTEAPSYRSASGAENLEFRQ